MTYEIHLSPPPSLTVLKPHWPPCCSSNIPGSPISELLHRVFSPYLECLSSSSPPVQELKSHFPI